MYHCKCQMDAIIAELERTVPIIWEPDQLTEQEEEEWRKLNQAYAARYSAPICSENNGMQCSYREVKDDLL